MRLRWLITAFLLSLLLAGLHFYALANHLYWYYRWFDTPMHLIAGVMIGTIAVGILLRFRPYSYMGFIALGAIGWEVFEYSFGLSTGQPNYVWDTLHDILNDVIGGVIVYVIARFTIWRSQ
jgi:uncharacterized membrane protein YeaQ/YmgE (transglycosylase-associated protein family)